MIAVDGVYAFALGIILIIFGAYILIVILSYKIGSGNNTIFGLVIETVDKLNFSAAPSSVPIIEFEYDVIFGNMDEHGDRNNNIRYHKC